MRPRRLAFFAASAAFAVAVLTAPLEGTAWAEPTEADIAQARQLGQQAQEAFDAGNFADSEKKWAAAQKLYSVAPTLTLGLARTQVKLGKLVAAQENYNKIIREWGDNPSPPPAFKEALDAARAEVGAVSARVANVTISVEGAPPNAKVTIDGDSVPNAALGLGRPVDPGQHVVKAVADGYLPAEVSFTVAEAGKAEAKLKMEKDPNAVVTPPPQGPGDTIPPPGGDDRRGGGSNKTLAYAAFGVGGVGLVLGTITGLVAIGKKSDLNSMCTDGRCPPSAQDTVDSYNTMGTLSTVGFIVGGVGIAAGAVLWLTAPKSTGALAPTTKTAKSDRWITPYVGPGSAGVTGRF